jgi:mannose-1-phosphate guanylyltransferase
MTQEFLACEYNSDREKICIETIYPKVEKISIDNGILEKAQNVYVIPADLGWSDLGTWTSVYENSDKNEDNNSIDSKSVLTYNAKNNIVRLKKGKAAIIDGLEDYIIVDTDKALLICPRENDQMIKDYVLDLKNFKREKNICKLKKRNFKLKFLFFLLISPIQSRFLSSFSKMIIFLVSSKS